MDEKIDTALNNVLAMIRANIKADEALKFAQAALNLANVKQINSGAKPFKTRGADAT